MELSPVIAKYDVDDFGAVTGIDINDATYPSIDGSEFSISFDTGTYSSGSWIYSGTAPDPNVKYWSAKGGNGFELFWTVDDSAVLAGGVCEAGSEWTLDCLQAAQYASSGIWNTPGGTSGDPGLSHLTFYNSGVVPVPAAVWLFGSGLLGLAGVARRKRT